MYRGIFSDLNMTILILDSFGLEFCVGALLLSRRCFVLRDFLSLLLRTHLRKEEVEVEVGTGTQRWELARASMRL